MLRFFGLLPLFTQLLTIPAFAQSDSDFMSSRDMLRDNPASGINLQNNRSTPVTVYGLYVRQFGYVTPGSSCASASPIYSATENTTAGAVVTPIMINAGKSAALGSNFLYNMIFQTAYYVSINFPGLLQCSLPGCTWGNDSTIYNWCMYLGALAPVTTSAGYTANVPPSTEAASSVGLYNYNLISNFVTLGPISCNDQTLTCSVANQQTQFIS